jgi:uncharacterized protein (DUF1501 family)
MRSHDPRTPLRTRRAFLRTSALGAATAWTIPLFLERTFGMLDAAAANAAVQTPTGRDARILVVLQMAGGNDGLNTLVPFADDAYHRARPGLALGADRVLKLDDHLGLHPNLAALKQLHDDGHLAVVQGVGYPNPNRSHFRSTEIWQTASDADRNDSTGWLGRYFDNCCEGADPSVGVSIGGEVPQAFASPTPTGISFARPEQYRWRTTEKAQGRMSPSEFYYRQLNRPGEEEGGGEASEGGSIGMIGGAGGSHAAGLGPLEYLQRTALDAQVSSDKVLEIARNFPARTEYPRGRLADSLNLVARMIAGGLPTRVYYVSQGGYDTHANQQGAHERLLAELGDGLAAFFKDLKEQGNFDRVLLMTFSEFGRRVAQNASGGTDHGTAAPLFIAGGGAKPGLYGAAPSLTKLDNGDLVHTTDFRSVYATVLEKWLAAPSEKVLGREFPSMPFV